MKFWDQLSEYNKIAKIDEIGRRYFAMNSFDGILTILGVLIGSFIAGIQEPKIVISTGLATSIAMGVSGMWGTYLTEEAERKKKLHELGKLTLRDLKDSKIGKAERAAALIVSFIDGISPFLSSVIIISPFFFASLNIMTMYLFSTVITFVLLLVLGGFLGHISKESIFFGALKMLFAGIVCAGLILLLGVPA